MMGIFDIFTVHLKSVLTKLNQTTQLNFLEMYWQKFTDSVSVYLSSNNASITSLSCM